MKANKEFRDEVVTCVNCGKEFHPRYSLVGEHAKTDGKTSKQ